MAKYLPPNGYMYDEKSGLFYDQHIEENADGTKSQIVNWFNADTGECTTSVYPVKKPGKIKRGLTWVMLYGACVMAIVIIVGLIALQVRRSAKSEIYSNTQATDVTSDNDSGGNNLAQLEEPQNDGTELAEAESMDSGRTLEYTIDTGSNGNGSSNEGAGSNESTGTNEYGETQGNQDVSNEESVPCVYDGYWFVEKDSKKSESELITLHIVSSTIIEVNGEACRAELAIGGTTTKEETWFHVYTSKGERGDLMIEANFKDIEYWPDTGSKMIEFVVDKQRMDAEDN
ncbi:MAG: hypothetical protein KBS85_00815 [Lachnospiraceae bacterium]|nr:hypothetical protein [Candidatus Merdinaster equi]